MASISLYLGLFTLLLLQPPTPAPTKAGGNPQETETNKATQSHGRDDSSKMTPPIHPSANDSEDLGDDKDKPQENEPAGSNPWPAVNAVLTLLFTGALTWFAYCQTKVLGQQSNIMGDEMQATTNAAQAAIETVEQMRLEQRAWLSITAEITRLDPGWPLGANFVFSNSGKTPALIHKIKIGGSIQSDYRLVDYDRVVDNHNRQPWEHRENTVAPNGVYSVPLEHGHVVTDDELGSLDADKYGVLYFVVTVQYSDFADGRESQVLLTYNTGPGRFLQWERHNYMK